MMRYPRSDFFAAPLFTAPYTAAFFAAALFFFFAGGRTASAQELEGVPERVEGHIIDVTTVTAQRLPFQPRGMPALIPYRLTLPIERPWRFPYTRPQQRKRTYQPAAPRKRNALADISFQAPGRALLGFSLSAGGENARAAFRVLGDAQSDAFTQGRGASNRIQAHANGAWENEAEVGRLQARWTSGASNWIRPDQETIAKEKTLLSADLSYERKPPMSGGTRQIWTARAVRYALPHESGDDRLTEASAGAAIELQAQGGNPRRIEAGGTARWTEGPLSAEARTAAVGRASLADRRVQTAAGVFGWRLGAAVFQQPQQPGDEDAGAAAAPDMRAAWTIGKDRGWGMRVEAGSGAELPSAQRCADTENSVLNPLLNVETRAGAGAALWARVRGVEAKAQAEWKRRADMSVWDETEVDGAPAWRPANLTAQFIEARASVNANLPPRFRMQSEIVWERLQNVENLEMDVLPYRPELRANIETETRLTNRLTLRAGGEWVGERVNIRGLFSGDRLETALEPYARLRGQLAVALSDAVSLLLNVETSLGEYRLFSSDDAPYEQTQHSAGAGFSGRF